MLFSSSSSMNKITSEQGDEGFKVCLAGCWLDFLVDDGVLEIGPLNTILSRILICCLAGHQKLNYNVVRLKVKQMIDVYQVLCFYF